MKPFTKFSPILLIIPLLFFLFYQNPWIDSRKKEDPVDIHKISKMWSAFSGNRNGKVIYARPPDMMILYLHSGIRRKINGITVEGGKGRRNRGKTPRPFWSPDGSFFVYRFSGNVYIASENGLKRRIYNKNMDISNETRWSIIILKGDPYIFGPSKERKGIAVNINDPERYVTVFPFPLIDKHCELTGDLKHIVYSNGKDIMVADISKGNAGIKISYGQSCRPCASPVSFAAWLRAPHINYNIHDVINGKFVKKLNAPVNEEIYRLNWSNDESFAAHMFGSRGNNRMNIRNIQTGSSLFIGYGWDPDLWIGRDQ